jgi:hypothetical protein
LSDAIVGVWSLTTKKYRSKITRQSKIKNVLSKQKIHTQTLPETLLTFSLMFQLAVASSNIGKIMHPDTVPYPGTTGRII